MIVFESWYQRYKDLFILDGRKVDDASRVRNLNTSAPEIYKNFILLKYQSEIDYEGTIAILKKIFG